MTTTPAEVVDAQSVVMHELVAPWRARERDFSRVPRPAPEMRVRILDAEPRHDVKGGEFVSFEVDSRRGGKKWRAGVLKGCVYPATKTIYLQEGDELRDARSVLGEDERSVPPHACKGSEA